MHDNIVRPAEERDLEAILQLTRANRNLLARLEPVYWNPSDNADENHALFMRYILTRSEFIKRVLVKQDQVVGFVVSSRQPTFWFVDDVCLSGDADWQKDGKDLFGAISERPAAMTAPHRDASRVQAGIDLGLEIVSTLRLIRFDRKQGTLSLDSSGTVKTSELPDNLIQPPLHPFSPAMTDESISVVTDEEGGYAVVSGSIDAPPVYNPGGTTAIIDRVVGGNRESLLTDALGFSAQRGDIGAILVIDARDKELAQIADNFEAAHPVDVMKWPEP